MTVVSENTDDKTNIGQSLRNRRLQKNITIETVAHDTRIHPRFLRALEEEKWGELPARVYLEGFLRQFAAYLGFDGDQYVRLYREQAGENRKPNFNQPEPRQELSSAVDVPSRFRFFLFGMVGLVLVAFYFYKMEKRSSAQAVKPVEEATPPPAPETPSSVSPMGQHQFQIRAQGRVWVRMRVDNTVPFEGPLQNGGATAAINGAALKVQSSNLSLITILIDGTVFTPSARDISLGESEWPSSPTAPAIPTLPAAGPVSPVSAPKPPTAPGAVAPYYPRQPNPRPRPLSSGWPLPLSTTATTATPSLNVPPSVSPSGSR